VLCLGDRDGTSAALALAEPRARVTALDVDDDVLAGLGEAAPEVTTVFGDLRVGLPESLAGACDLVFTDPPYTPEGIRLFLARGLEAVAPRPGARLAFCYGHGERQPELGYRVQEVVHELRLLLEAVLPGFNAYRGAEAIGSRSALYLCRPTRRTWPALRRLGPASERIYTHGPAAQESAPDPLPDAATDGAGPPVAPARLLAEGADAPALVVLHPLYDALLPRVLLLARAPALRVVAGPGALARVDGPLAAAADARWTRGAREVGGLTVLDLGVREPAPPLGALLALLAARPRTKLGNAWREALIALAGGALTKNGARERIAAANPPRGVLDARALELPAHRLRALIPALERSLPPSPPPRAAPPPARAPRPPAALPPRS